MRAAKDPTKIPTEFKGFQFTGPLRPCQKTKKREVPDHIMKPDYAMDENGVSISEKIDKRTNNTIRVYTTEEIEKIRNACIIGREVLDIAGKAVRVGITCDEVSNEFHSLFCFSYLI